MSDEPQEQEKPKVAYFSMEIALDPALPTYSGGLGVLAGDTLRTAADLEVPMCGVTLVHREGYFRQMLSHAGAQTEEPNPWDVSQYAELMPKRTSVKLDGQMVTVQAWRYIVKGVNHFTVPIYLLDTACEGNSEYHRTLTNRLYGGDAAHRLRQEAILGLGGVEILRLLGHSEVSIFHMNEGHAALLSLALLEEMAGVGEAEVFDEMHFRAIRRKCVFTTHTPVPAGHDQFASDLVEEVLGPKRAKVLRESDCCVDHSLNMTYLGLRSAHYINGVAMHHGAVSQDMYPNYPIRAITNGVHLGTWVSAPFQQLFDRHIPAWRTDADYLRYAIGIRTDEIRDAHRQAKLTLVEEVNRMTPAELDPEIFTVGFARRAATYKRFDLLFDLPDRLLEIARNVGKLQVVFGGKAHPADAPGKAQIQRVFAFAAKLNCPELQIVFVEDYGMEWAKLLTGGCDLWLNTPQRPLEASGTSGMKAAANGVPSLSILDGWWIEGCLEGATGWAIGRDGDIKQATEDEANSLYEKLGMITDMFYKQREDYLSVCRTAIAINGSFFNSQRMLQQYVANAYFDPAAEIRFAEEAQ